MGAEKRKKLNIKTNTDPAANWLRFLAIPFGVMLCWGSLKKLIEINTAMSIDNWGTFIAGLLIIAATFVMNRSIYSGKSISSRSAELDESGFIYFADGTFISAIQDMDKGYHTGDVFRRNRILSMVCMERVLRRTQTFYRYRQAYRRIPE